MCVVQDNEIESNISGEGGESGTESPAWEINYNWFRKD